MSNYIYTNDQLVNADELRHYGVLGMKWGKRRATKYKNKARTARESAKEWDEMARFAKSKGKDKKAAKYASNAAEDRADAKKYEQKSKKIADKHAKLAGGKNVYDAVTKQSTGRLIAKSLLMGTYGTLKYEQAKQRGAGRGKAVVEGILYQSGSSATGGLLEIIEPRVR